MHIVLSIWVFELTSHLRKTFEPWGPLGELKCTLFNVHTGNAYEWKYWTLYDRGGICPSRQCRWQCKIFASGVNFSIFTHFFVFFLTKTVEIRWNWWCKIFSPKIRRCKFSDKFHVWKRITCFASGYSILTSQQWPYIAMILYYNAMFQFNYDNDSSLSLSLSQQVTWWATTRHLDGTPHLQWKPCQVCPVVLVVWWRPRWWWWGRGGDKF